MHRQALKLGRVTPRLSISFPFTVKEYCKATYGYEATNQDELDIKEGDIVHLLSKVSRVR